MRFLDCYLSIDFTISSINVAPSFIKFSSVEKIRDAKGEATIENFEIESSLPKPTLRQPRVGFCLPRPNGSAAYDR